MRGDYETPELLRRSVAAAPYRRATPSSMLTNWQHLGSTYGAATNWSTFAKPLALPSSHQDLHVPLFDWAKACPACIFGSIVLFQPAQGRVAAMVAGPQDLIDKVRASDMVGAPFPMAMK